MRPTQRRCTSVRRKRLDWVSIHTPEDNFFIFSFPCSGNKPKRGVEFNSIENLAEFGERSVLALPNATPTLCRLDSDTGRVYSVKLQTSKIKSFKCQMIRNANNVINK